MEEDQQNQNKNEKPRYYATDFNEIKENLSDEEKLLFERYKEMLSGIIPADSASSGHHLQQMMLHSDIISSSKRCPPPSHLSP